MIRRLIDRLRPAPIRDAAALQQFLSGEASYLAQRSTYEFTRNTLAWFGQSAFGDDKFNEVFRICRWESFASILAGFVVLARTRLASDARGNEAALAAGLIAVYRGALDAYPMPAHRSDWADMTSRLGERLAAADQAVLTPTQIGAMAAERVIETVPVRSGNAAEDRKVLANAVRLGTIGVNDRLAARLDAAALVRDLVARGHDAGAAAAR